MKQKNIPSTCPLSHNYRIQKEWRDTFATKYKDLLENLNKGGILTYEMVRQAVVEGNTYTALIPQYYIFQLL